MRKEKGKKSKASRQQESHPLEDNIPNEKHSKAEAAFYRLSRDLRDKLRTRYANKGWSYEDWLAKAPDKWAKRARVKLAFGKADSRRPQAEDRAHRKGKAKKAVTLTISSNPKHLDKEVRKLLKVPAPPKNPYAALMVPMVIVPDDPQAKVVVADAGTIVKLADQSTLYRDRMSPITRRGDEILVHYGKAKSPTLGWITHKLDKKAMKPSKGPTFLVTTRNEDQLNAWEQFRLKCARSRKSDEGMWIAPWLALHGRKHQSQLREVTRFFGGKPIKNESTDARIERLFTLILHTEMDMATAKSKKSKKGKNAKSAAAEKPSKKNKKAKKSAKESRVSSDRVTSKHDDHVIKRLVKENPRRAGSEKAKIWDKLKKGMTVGEFVKKGGSRGAVRLYVQNGWAKLLKPKGDDE